MKVEIVSVRWIENESRRLDCQPFTSGGFQSRMAIESLSCEKMQLKEVSLRGVEGIYHVGQEKIRWVESSEYGIPFLRSSDILLSNLSHLSLISKKQVAKNPFFQFPQGATLITRSGTIGRTAYARNEMVGMAASQDVLKVVPDEEKISSGYLYAYLSSRYGVPQIVSGTFGSIIVHIEPENISDLPVPRFDKEDEQKIHQLIESASLRRSVATKKEKDAIYQLHETLGLDTREFHSSPLGTSFFTVASSALTRFDAFHHSPNTFCAIERLKAASASSVELGDLAQVFTPGIFKRIHVEDPNYGYAYYSGSELFQTNPIERGHLSKKSPEIKSYIVKKDWLLIQDAGQVDGLIGRVVRVAPYADSAVVSNHLMRVVCNNKKNAAYLFAFFSSPFGYRSIIRHAFGSSIPQLDPAHIRKIKIPWLEEEIKDKIAELVINAWQLRDEADMEETLAIELVNQLVECKQ